VNNIAKNIKDKKNDNFNNKINKNKNKRIAKCNELFSYIGI
jgi:hypothetical protein